MPEIPPNVQPPTEADIREKAAQHFIDLSDDEVEFMANAIPDVLAHYERLDEIPEPTPDRTFTSRDPGYRPAEDDDPHNAFVRRCLIRGAGDGQLSGCDVGLKDNIAVAGVPMTCGSKVFEGYVPSADATVATRLLDAGADIVGKLNLENMAYSGSGELSATGPVFNPRDPEYLAGGSSSGPAAAVVAGEVDVAIGGDQGGSIRTPAAWCGCVGLKPTHGLVPYSGAVGFGHTFDHLGPLAGTVEDCARVLDVIAGEDPLDPRQHGVETEDYPAAAADAAPSETSVALLEEAFAVEGIEAGVRETVRDAIDAVGEAGAAVRSVSVPEHEDGLAIWHGITTEALAALVRDEGVGHFRKGGYDTQFAEAFARARRTRADDFPPTLKLVLVLGQYLADEYHSHYHAKAQNLRRVLASAYDEALAEAGADALVFPTSPHTAHEAVRTATRVEVFERAGTMLANVAPFNVTGHPAVTVPCGTVDGLPVGLTCLGRRFEDGTVLAAASAVESVVDWDG